MFRFPPLTPFVKKLLIALFGTWILQIILQNWGGVPAFEFLALDTARPGVRTLWQLGTHVFAFPTGPQAVFSMLIVLLFLWLMLAPFEQRFGEKRTIQLCIVAACRLPSWRSSSGCSSPIRRLCTGRRRFSWGPSRPLRGRIAVRAG